jgi:hypothetical protein
MIRRRLLTCLSVLSLILCVGTVALWVRSYWRDDGLDWPSGNANAAVGTGIYSSGGTVRCQRVALPALMRRGLNFKPQPLQFFSLPHVNVASIGSQPPVTGPSILNVGFLGFGLVADTEGSWSQGPIWLELPDWAVILLMLILPVLWLRNAMRRRLIPGPAHCTACSYDLTGNLSGTCPECGRPISRKSGTAE